MPMQITDISLNQLRYFVRTAELQSMSRAAESLFVAQSAISTSVGNLERSLGVQLLVRHRSKGTTLTREGAEFFRRARAILLDLEDATDVIRPDALRGQYVVGCFPTLVPFWMPSVCDGLTIRHPQLQARVVEVRPHDIDAVLHDRELEFVLTYDYAVPAGVDFTPVATAPLHAIVAEHHPLANADAVSLAELSRDPFILLDLPSTGEYFLETLASVGAAPAVTHRFGNYEAVRAMVARGHGFSLLNQAPQHDLAYNGLGVRSLELTDDLPDLCIGIAHLGDRGLSRKARAVIDECRRYALESRATPITRPSHSQAAPVPVRAA
ncbi:DNA-binding transcriptional LysR family regulator [Pseudoclavibacter chungangensis]|nr:LysR family transcriptional regulator [Pseudoclavibacter chungangensis]NYJ67905.1 DNA-binding transcriptional LysR family regulator [Pseudoclavibacter chungangensis]